MEEPDRGALPRNLFTVLILSLSQISNLQGRGDFGLRDLLMGFTPLLGASAGVLSEGMYPKNIRMSQANKSAAICKTGRRRVVADERPF